LSVTASQKLVVAPALVRKDTVPSNARVYDLTVEDAHCFFANGVLVLNCQDALQMIATGEFSLLSGLVNKEDVMVKKAIRQGYNPLQSTGRPTFARANWLRR
jgi:hypothetical protein